MDERRREFTAKYKRSIGLGVNSKRKSPSSFYGSPSDVESLMTRLKTARATGSGDVQLDAAVDPLVADGEQLVSVWTPMDSYFRTKAFLDDD